MERNKAPLVSYCVFCYNQEKFIEEALQSAFNQTYDNLEIIISDDCSTDSTFYLIESMVASYKGSHKIEVNRNPHNLGVSAHFNYVMNNLVNGEVVMLSAGDDIAFNNRTSKSIKLLIDHDLNTITFNGKYINQDGNLLNNNIFNKEEGMDIYTINNYINGDKISVHGASRCFYKYVYDYFGPLNCDTPTEDTPLTLRSLLLGRIGNCYEPIILYRTHDKSLSGLSNLLKMDYTLISKQYRDDVRKIDNKYSSSIINKILKRINDYEIKSKLFRISFIELMNPLTLLSLLFTPLFSIREKLSIIKRTILKK